MVEIVISTVIFALAAVGTFTVLFSMRESSNVSDRSVEAAYVGRQILEQLRGQIDQETWGDWANQLGLTCDSTPRQWPGVLPTTRLFADFGGSVNYVCQNISVSGPADLRQFNLIITWDEPD